jgi:hypothetical protein
MKNHSKKVAGKVRSRTVKSQRMRPAGCNRWGFPVADHDTAGDRNWRRRPGEASRLLIPHPWNDNLTWRFPVDQVAAWTGRSPATVARWGAGGRWDALALRLCMLVAYGLPTVAPAYAERWHGFHFNAHDGALVTPEGESMYPEVLRNFGWIVRSHERQPRLQEYRAELARLQEEVTRLREMVAYA